MYIFFERNFLTRRSFEGIRVSIWKWKYKFNNENNRFKQDESQICFDLVTRRVQNKMNKTEHTPTVWLLAVERARFFPRSMCNRLYDLIETRTNVNETFQRKSTVQLFKVAALGLDQMRAVHDVFNATYAKSERIQWFRSWASIEQDPIQDRSSVSSVFLSTLFFSESSKNRQKYRCTIYNLYIGIIGS